MICEFAITGYQPGILGRVGFEVSTPVFEGPFDLLLNLITSEKVDVYQISLSGIVDRFVEEMEKLSSEIDLETSTQFALIASILIQLKCRRLLPDPTDIDLEEEIALLEERDLLLSKLLEASTFKDVAALFRFKTESAALSLPRMSGMEDEFADIAPDPIAGLKPEQLAKALARCLSPKPEPELKLDHVTAVKVSVAETVKRIATALSELGSASFRDLTAEMSEPIEIVAAFLAILELYKENFVDLEQQLRFGPLFVSWIYDLGVGAPAERVLTGVAEEYDG